MFDNAGTDKQSQKSSKDRMTYYLVTVTEGLSSMDPLTQGHFFDLQARITTITKITATAAIKDTSTPTTIGMMSSDPPEEELIAKSERIKINHKLDYE